MNRRTTLSLFISMASRVFLSAFQGWGIPAALETRNGSVDAETAPYLHFRVVKHSQRRGAGPRCLAR